MPDFELINNVVAEPSRIRVSHPLTGEQHYIVIDPDRYSLEMELRMNLLETMEKRKAEEHDEWMDVETKAARVRFARDTKVAAALQAKDPVPEETDEEIEATETLRDRETNRLYAELSAITLDRCELAVTGRITDDDGTVRYDFGQCNPDWDRPRLAAYFQLPQMRQIINFFVSRGFQRRRTADPRILPILEPIPTGPSRPNRAPRRARA